MNITKLKRILFKASILVITLFIIFCSLLYIFQEKFIFFPDFIDKNYNFQFSINYEEKFIKTDDNILLNGLLFKTNQSKGLIFYLHGNGGSLDSWGKIAKTYVNLNYDIFILDYRGYGKSNGFIENEQRLFKDIQIAYDEIKKLYKEQDIIIIGYSLGTGFASKLSSQNNPKKLILQAPFYSFSDLLKNKYPFLPTFLLKYKFETNEYLKSCNAPIYIFHGTLDEVIYFNSSVKLKDLLPNKIKLYILEGQTHSGMTNNEVYKSIISELLN